MKPLTSAVDSDSMILSLTTRPSLNRQLHVEWTDRAQQINILCHNRMKYHNRVKKRVCSCSDSLLGIRSLLSVRALTLYFNIVLIVSSISASEICSASSCILPLSIRLISRMSLILLSRWLLNASLILPSQKYAHNLKCKDLQRFAGLRVTW